MKKQDIEITNEKISHHLQHRQNMLKAVYPKMIEIARADIRNDDPYNISPKEFLKIEANTKFLINAELLELIEFLEIKGLSWQDFKAQIAQIYSLPF